MAVGNQIQKLDHSVEDALIYIISGYSRLEVIDRIKKSSPDLTDKQAVKAYTEASNRIRDKATFDLNDIINLHVKWYEDLWRKFDSLDYIPGKNAALRQKEKILGLLKEENIIKIENEVNVDIKSKAEYDVDKLTPEEQKRLDSYLKKVVVK